MMMSHDEHRTHENENSRATHNFQLLHLPSPSFSRTQTSIQMRICNKMHACGINGIYHNLSDIRCFILAHTRQRLRLRSRVAAPIHASSAVGCSQRDKLLSKYYNVYYYYYHSVSFDKIINTYIYALYIYIDTARICVQCQCAILRKNRSLFFLSQPNAPPTFI